MFENMNKTLKGLNIDDVYADKVNLVIHYKDGSSSNISSDGFSVKKTAIEDIRFHKPRKFIDIKDNKLNKRAYTIKEVISKYKEISLETAKQICLDLKKEIDNYNRRIEINYIIYTFKKFSIEINKELASKIFNILNMPVEDFKCTDKNIKSLLNENKIKISLIKAENIVTSYFECFDEYCHINNNNCDIIDFDDYKLHIDSIPFDSLIAINENILNKYDINIPNINRTFIAKMWSHYYESNKNESINLLSDKFKIGYISFLNRLKNYSVGIISELDNDNSLTQYKFFDIAYVFGHIRNCLGLGVLKSTEMSDIKVVLRKYGLKVSGSKKDLINRVKENLTIDIINKEFPGDAYCLTEKGKKFIKEFEEEMFYQSQNSYSNDLSTVDVYTTRDIGFKREYLLFLNYLKDHPAEIMDKLFNKKLYVNKHTFNNNLEDKNNPSKYDYIFEELPNTRYLKYKFFNLANNLDHIKNCHGLGVIKKSLVPDIRIVLRKYGLKVSGSKKDLINRVKENLTIDIINKEFPGDAYCLTEKGKEFLNEFDYYLYYINNVISFKEYIEICELNPELSTFDILITIYDNLIRKYIEINANCPDLYFLFLNKSYIYKSFKDDLNELKTLLIIHNNSNSKIDIYDKESGYYNLYYTSRIRSLCRKLKLSDEEYNNIYKSVLEDVKKYNIPKMMDLFEDINDDINEENIKTVHIYEKDYEKFFYSN